MAEKKYISNKTGIELDAAIGKVLNIEEALSGTAATIPSSAAVKNYVDSKLVDTESTLSGDAVYDISEANNGTTYVNLDAALNNGNNIPASIRKGGISIKFIQSSDNKYVQYRLMADTFSTIENDWQGVDEEPTAGSKNLVESDGVYQETMYPKNVDITSKGVVEYGYISDGNITDWGGYSHITFPVQPNAKYHIEGSLFGNISIYIYNSSSLSSETLTRKLGAYNKTVNIDVILTSEETYISIPTKYNTYPSIILKQIKIKDEVSQIENEIEDIEGSIVKDTLPTKASVNTIQSNAVLVHGGALDISIINAVNDTAKSYSTLELALADIPTLQRCAGLKVKYIDSVSQKYVFARYMGTVIDGEPNPFLSGSNWQIVDSKVSKDSKNLIESGSVYEVTNLTLNKDVTSEGVVEDGYITQGGNITDFGGYSHYVYKLRPFAKYHIQGDLQGNVHLCTFSSSEFSSSTKIRTFGPYEGAVNIDITLQENELYLGIPTKYGKHPNITIIDIPVTSTIVELQNVDKELQDEIDELNNKRTNYYGITVGLLGDSLAGNNRYVKSLVDILGVTMSKVAYGGRRIQDYATDAILNALSNNCKVIIVQGGTNDWEQVGNIAIDNYDTTTLCGAFNVMLSKLYYKYLHQEIGYYDADGIDYSGVTQISSPVAQLPVFVILPPVAPKEPYSSYKDRIERNSDALKQIAYMWGLPVIDARLIGASEMTITSADKIHGCMEFFNMLDALVYSKFMEYEPGMVFFNDVKTLYTITASISTGSVNVSASAYNGNQVYFTIEDNTSYTNILIQDADENTISYETIDLSKHAYAFRMPSSNVTITVS